MLDTFIHGSLIMAYFARSVQKSSLGLLACKKFKYLSRYFLWFLPYQSCNDCETDAIDPYSNVMMTFTLSNGLLMKSSPSTYFQLQEKKDRRKRQTR